jgi:hypothetical protein
LQRRDAGQWFEHGNNFKGCHNSFQSEYPGRRKPLWIIRLVWRGRYISGRVKPSKKYIDIGARLWGLPFMIPAPPSGCAHLELQWLNHPCFCFNVGSVFFLAVSKHSPNIGLAMVALGVAPTCSSSKAPFIPVDWLPSWSPVRAPALPLAVVLVGVAGYYAR